jgi:hypothetical protein
MRFLPRWTGTLLVGTTVLLIGCKSDDPALAKVSGTITLAGNPLTNASVTFIPMGDTPGFGGVGKTDASGKYALAGSRNNEPGIPTGQYRVVISKRLMPDGSEVAAGEAPTMSPAKESLPDVYSSMSMTTLTATVPAGGGTIDFPLAAVGKKK